MESGEQHARPVKSKSWLWIILAILLALLAIGALWWWRGSRMAASVDCTPADLVLSTGYSESKNDKMYIFAVLKNTSKHSCNVSGYPTASLLDKDDKRLGLSSAQNNDAYPVATFSVAPGEQAHAVLAFPDAEKFDAGDCTAASTTLRLHLPGNVTATSVALRTPLSQRICPGYSISSLQPGA